MSVEGDCPESVRANIKSNVDKNNKANASSNFNNPKNGLTVREWPPYPGSIDQLEADYTLLPGTKIDRFGQPKGSFLSPIGTAYSDRSLKPGTLKEDYYVYEVKKPLTVKAGEILPWFGETGGGIQYRLDIINNMRRSPATLTQGNEPYLEELYRGKFQDYKPE